MTLQVFGDRVLVTPQEEENVSSSGIVLTNTSREYKVGVVKAVDRMRHEYGKMLYNEVRVGDTVYYDRFTRIDDETHLISISNILCFERPEVARDEEDVFEEDE